MLRLAIRVPKSFASQKRSFGMFDSLLNDPNAQEKAVNVLKDPVEARKSIDAALNMMKGDSLTATMLRNGPMKGVLEKIGGIENLERMMQDPRMMQIAQSIASDPEKLKQAMSSVKEFSDKVEGEKK
jgi:hypothetical protein